MSDIEDVKRVFKLSDEELNDPKLRKGYPGRIYFNYPSTENWKKDMIIPHPNYRGDLAAYYKASGICSIRGELMEASNKKKPTRKVK